MSGNGEFCYWRPGWKPTMVDLGDGALMYVWPRWNDQAVEDGLWRMA